MLCNLFSCRYFSFLFQQFTIRSLVWLIHLFLFCFVSFCYFFVFVTVTLFLHQVCRYEYYFIFFIVSRLIQYFGGGNSMSFFFLCYLSMLRLVKLLCFFKSHFRLLVCFSLHCYLSFVSFVLILFFYSF
jgi:hypothetical protein